MAPTPQPRKGVAASRIAAAVSKAVGEALASSRPARRAEKGSDGKAKPDWPCRFTDCPVAVSERLNYGHRVACFGCKRAKQHAMNPPLTLSCVPPEPTTSTTTSTTAKPKKTPAPAPAPSTDSPGAVALAMTGVWADKARETPKRLQGDTEAQKIGAAELQEVDLSLLYRGPPTTNQEPQTAEQIIGKASPVAASAAIAEKEREFEDAKKILALTPTSCPIYEANAEYCKSVEAALAKLRKQQPCGKVYAQQLRSAKQAQFELRAKWQEKNDVGKQKAAELHQVHLKAIDDLTAALHVRRVALVTTFNGVSAQWATFNQKRADQWQQVLQQFDALIAAADHSEADAVANRAPPLALAAPPPAVPLEDALAKAQQAAAAAPQALAKLQQEFLVAQQAHEANMAKDIPIPDEVPTPPELVTFECEPGEIPSMLPEPAPEQWEEYHRLYTALDTLAAHEITSNSVIPVSFAQLRCGYDVPKLLLGDALWAKAFPSGSVEGTTIVSKQVRGLLWHSLKQHQAKLIADKARYDAAIKAAEACMDEIAQDLRAKKRRAVAASAAGA